MTSVQSDRLSTCAVNKVVGILHSRVEQCLLCLPAHALPLWPETRCELLQKCLEPFELESQFQECSSPPVVAL